MHQGVVRANGDPHAWAIPNPRLAARDVAIPPHLLPMVRAHILEHAAPGRDGLLFPGSTGGHLTPSTLYGRKAGKNRKGWGFYEARAQAGREDLRWHDLRHTGAVLAASTGATLAELMGRLGHSTPGAALRYQHAAQGRDMEIARKLSALVEGRPVSENLPRVGLSLPGFDPSRALVAHRLQRVRAGQRPRTTLRPSPTRSKDVVCPSGWPADRTSPTGDDD